MKYLSWATFYEGNSDEHYFDVLIYRLLDDIFGRLGADIIEFPLRPTCRFGRYNRTVDVVAKEACEMKNALDLVFFHADTGGRSLNQGIASRSQAYCDAMLELCDWPLNRSITILPSKETEAWVLADCQAVLDACGYKGTANSLGLPSNAPAAERLADPKKTLLDAVSEARGRRKHNLPAIFVSIAQRQSFGELRRSASFAAFETRLTTSLGELGYLN